MILETHHITRRENKMLTRCNWPGIEDPLYQKYHDTEWGKLNLDEDYLYEMLVLESFQSGLSWLTILRKRENFRRAFASFDVEKVAQFGSQDDERLLQDKGIIRNRLKVRAAINNARVLVQMHQEGNSLAALLKDYVPELIVNHPQTMDELPSQTALSAQVACALKKCGFKFVGPTTVYSYLEAVGLINDHLEDCAFK